MNFLQKVDALEALYDDPLAASLKKVTDHLTQIYTKWIMASRFCVLSTVGPNGTDGSPRGDDQPVVRIADNKTLLMPDWRGNNWSCPAYVPVPQLIYAAFRSKAKGLLPPSDEWRRRGL